MTFAVGMLGRFQSNLGMDHQIAAKKVIKWLVIQTKILLVA
jgi:hypothetical protein